jgi:serine/threonine protein phosphatase PrpC
MRDKYPLVIADGQGGAARSDFLDASAIKSVEVRPNVPTTDDPHLVQVWLHLHATTKAVLIYQAGDSHRELMSTRDLAYRLAKRWNVSLTDRYQAVENTGLTQT